MVYLLTAGWLFGAWQVGFFLALQASLSSAYVTYLTVTLAWLGGVVAGLLVAPRLSERASLFWLAAAQAAYWLSWAALAARPFETSWLAAHGVFVAVSGSYVGFFFRRASNWAKPASRLFFWENNGFLLGLLMTPAAYMLGGRSVLLFGPLLLIAALWRLDGKWR